MIFASEKTQDYLGDFLDYLNSVATNPVVMISRRDITGVHPVAYELAYNIYNVAPHIAPFISETEYSEIREAIQKNESAAWPVELRFDNTASYGIVFLAEYKEDPRHALLDLANLLPSENFFPRTRDSRNIIHIIALHELYHVRKGRRHLREASDFDRYVEEVGADNFALHHISLSVPQHHDVIDDMIVARHLSAIHGVENKTHCTGPVLATSCADDINYTLYYDATLRFYKKVRATAYMDAYGMNKPASELYMSFKPMPYLSLSKGRDVVGRMLQDQMFEGLEIKAAELYLEANQRWSSPVRSTRPGARPVVAAPS